MDILYLLLLFPMVWPFIAKYVWHSKLNWLEVALNVAIVVITVTIIFQIGRYSKTADVEVWNGRVMGKEKVYVSCDHSYRCFCYESCSGTGNDRSCVEVCQTCYEHSNDWDWMVHSDIESFEIARVDHQGSIEPPRWSKVQIGESVAREKRFINYIKAVPESLFHDRGKLTEQFTSQLPDYPRVYDYYRIKRVLPMGVSIPDLPLWERELSEKLQRLGPKKEANVIIVLVSTNDTMYAHALKEHWLGGKKNDIVVILGIAEYPKIAWVYVMSWTDKEIFKVQLRDALLAQKTLDRQSVINTIDSHIYEAFVRKPMADFAYLKDAIEPPLWALVLTFVVGALGSISLTYLFHRHDFRFER